MASMADTVTRTARAVRGGRRTGTRHPLVAAAMVLPLAALLAYAFGGVDAVVTQASSVAGLMGR
jgi:DNA-binding transcriptional regulator YbjK